MAESDQKVLIDNETFREKYADARINSKEYKKYTEELNSVVSKLNSKSFVSKLSGSTASVYEAVFGDKPLGSVFDGSVPDNYIKMQIDGQKMFLKNLFVSKMENAEKFDDLKNVAEQDMVNRLARIRAFTATIDSLPDKPLSHAEINALVLWPLRSMTYNSIVYSDSAMDFERDVISQLKVSDSPFNKDSVEKSKNLWSVYHHFTAFLDDPKLDKPMAYNPNDLEIFDRQKQREYLKYVNGEMKNKIGSFLDNKISVNPYDWEIQSYSDWVNDPGRVSTSLTEAMPMGRDEVESEIQRSCRHVLKQYENDDYEAVATMLYQAYDSKFTVGAISHSLIFSQKAINIAGDSSLMTRTDQLRQVQLVATAFKQHCDQVIDEAVTANLKSQTEWKGKIEQWLYNSLKVRFDKN